MGQSHGGEKRKFTSILPFPGGSFGGNGGSLFVFCCDRLLKKEKKKTKRRGGQSNNYQIGFEDIRIILIILILIILILMIISQDLENLKFGPETLYFFNHLLQELLKWLMEEVNCKAQKEGEEEPTWKKIQNAAMKICNKKNSVFLFLFLFFVFCFLFFVFCFLFFVFCFLFFVFCFLFFVFCFLFFVFCFCFCFCLCFIFIFIYLLFFFFLNSSSLPPKEPYTQLGNCAFNMCSQTLTHAQQKEKPFTNNYKNIEEEAKTKFEDSGLIFSCYVVGGIINEGGGFEVYDVDACVCMTAVLEYMVCFFILFCFVFFFILFCFVLFFFILFCFVLFCFLLFFFCCCHLFN